MRVRYGVMMSLAGLLAIGAGLLAADAPFTKVAEIDAASGKVTATVPLEGAVETGAADPALGKVYVNIEDKDEVMVIDTGTHMVTAKWPIAPAEGGTGMAIDPSTHRVFVGGDKFLVMLDGQNGKVVSNVPICDGTDATSFDPSTKNIFA